MLHVNDFMQFLRRRVFQIVTEKTLIYVNIVHKNKPSKIITFNMQLVEKKLLFLSLKGNKNQTKNEKINDRIHF